MILSFAYITPPNNISSLAIGRIIYDVYLINRCLLRK